MWRRAQGLGLGGLGLGLGGRRGGAGRAGGACWSCGSPSPCPAAPPRFCPACRALQPPDRRADLFRLLGCERTFRLDEADLQRRFRSLQRRLHPDLFARRSQAERDFSAQHSALVNEAYGTLRSPLRRGLYLLELSGEALERGADAQAEPEFLARILELDERLSASGAGPAHPALEAHIAAQQEELSRALGQAFDQGDLQKAKQVLVKMKYFANLEEKVKKKKVPS